MRDKSDVEMNAAGVMGVGTRPLLGLRMMQAVLDLGRGIGVIEPKQADISYPGNVLSPPSLRPTKLKKMCHIL